jgi:5-methyltetrahydropteroyltriglutamate--homocysteine methyltransferase
MKPPFRAEHIGSLLRPPALLDLRRRHARGEVDAATLHAAEDAAIAEAIALQERVGLRLATDGEFRRGNYHGYFFGRLGDIDPSRVEDTGATSGRGAQPRAVINTRLEWTGPIHAEDFAFLKARTTLVPKITIPGPCALHFRGGDAAILASAYRDVDAFWEDTVRAFRAELTALAQAGCTYVQIDETAFAKFGDTQTREVLKARGDDWSTLIDRYIDITNRVLDGLPSTLRIGMHLCRGNRGGQWHAEGGYEPVAERLFNRLAIEFFFLEFDSERAGSFEPLRFLPRDRQAVLGLVSTKGARMESVEELRRRIGEAARFVDIERLAISPQCGFASVDTGNPVTTEVQEAKLRRVVEVAQKVWPDA